MIKPIFEKIWRHKAARNAHSNGGSRRAFSCLFGAVTGVVQHQQPNMHSFRFFKSFLNIWQNTEPKSAEKFLQLCRYHSIPELLPIRHPNAKNRRNGQSNNESNTSLFSFRVYTSTQNQGQSQQMNCGSFLYSMEKMIGSVIFSQKLSQAHQKTIVIHIDNATYHRQLVQCEWSVARSEYSVKRQPPEVSRLLWLRK